MKTKLTILMLLFSFTGLLAQTEKNKKFEISLFANFWTPTSLHLKSFNSVTQYSYPGGINISQGTFSGYGTSLAPGLDVKYNFNDKISLAFGFYMVHMDNELFVTETDSTFTSYENLADIPNFTLGITGKFFTQKNLELYYETGINFVPGYGLETTYANESSDPQDMDAEGLALGVYCRTGANFKIVKFLYFKTSLMYSFIPAEIEYTNTEGSAKTNVKTNLGGVGLETGLLFKF